MIWLGIIIVLAGIVSAVLKRQNLTQMLICLCAADLGYFLVGLAAGGISGGVGATFQLFFTGAARALAWFCLLRIYGNSGRGREDSLANLGKEKPLTAALFALGMFAALGISPFLTPDARPLILHSALYDGNLPVALLLAASTAVMSVLTVLAVHDIWLGKAAALPEENYAPGPAPAEEAQAAPAESVAAQEAPAESAPAYHAHGDAPAQASGLLAGLEKNRSFASWKAEAAAMGLKLPLILAAALVFMGLFGHLLTTGLAALSSAPAESLADFALYWHPGLIVTALGAFAAFIVGQYNPKARNILAAAALALALVLVWVDSSLAPLGRFFGVVVTGVGLLVTIYSWSYIHEERASSYYFFLLLMFGSLLGLAVAKSLGGFYVFWEIMTLSSYVLVSWEGTERAHYSAKKYFIMCAVAAAFMLPGLMLFQVWYGSLEVAALSLNASSLASGSAALAAVLVLIGCGVKAGLVPGHSWLPDAHPAAPSSISGPLSGVLTKAGIFGMVQVFLVIIGAGAFSASGQPLILGLSGIGGLVCLLGLVTMLYGEIMALYQKDIKRLFAYSTMGQVGEITLTLGLFSYLATAGALLHVFNHAVMKDLLFLCSGALILRSGSRNLEDLKGLGKAMPFTATCMIVGLISILGLPPFAGFMSKYTMIYALAAVNPLLAGIMLLASLAGVIYYTRIIKTLIFEPYNGPAMAEPAVPMRAVMGVLAGLCLLLGLFPQIGLSLVMPVVDALAGSGKVAAQAMPSLIAKWPLYTIVLMAGGIVPGLLRKNKELAGKMTALVLGVAAVLVFMDWQNFDTLSLIFAIIITVIGCTSMVYAVGYMDHSHTQWRFYAFFLFMCAGLTGVAAAKDLFNFFLFWEIMSSWSLYFVIVHEENEAALREGFKYFFFNVLGAAFIFLAVAMVSHWAGSADFEAVRNILPRMGAGQTTLVLALFAIGFVMKAAQLPFRIDIQMHPNTAPTPVSGFISSVLLKSAIFGLAKLFLVLGGGTALAGAVAPLLPGQDAIMHICVWVGGVTIVMAATYAVIQSDFKLVLIYSTVSQLGYMVVGVSLGTSLGVAGGLLHLINHVFFKDLLFLVAGVVIVRAHCQDMNSLGGLARRMPQTMGLFALGALCVIGIPPSSGFTSKWIIYHALMEQGYPFVAFLSLLGSVLTLAYFAKVLHLVFFGNPSPGMEHVTEAPKIMLVPMYILGAGCLVTSVFPGSVLLPLNNVLAEFGLAQLEVAPWGLASGAGAWNATLTSILFLVAGVGGYIVLRRLTGARRITEIHTCGIPPEELDVRSRVRDIYSAPVTILARLRKSPLITGKVKALKAKN
ncbi:oxidoreductase [Desulfovibrio sp. OttesenSCG-928-C14]|nr:oxidoreductase [Desulfovibrio sp. OttesenSCG-928-C14]